MITDDKAEVAAKLIASQLGLVWKSLGEDGFNTNPTKEDFRRAGKAALEAVFATQEEEENPDLRPLGERLIDMAPDIYSKRQDGQDWIKWTGGEQPVADDG